MRTASATRRPDRLEERRPRVQSIIAALPRQIRLGQLNHHTKPNATEGA